METHAAETEVLAGGEGMGAPGRDVRSFVRAAPVAIAAFDKDMRYLAASDRWCADFRISGRQVAGADHLEWFPQLADLWREAGGKVLGGSIQGSREDLFTLGDGTEEFMDWEMTPWLDASGSVVGIIACVRPVSDHRRAEAELSRANRALRALSRSKHALLGAVSEDALLQEICSAVVQVAGYRVAWIGFAENDERRSVRRKAVAGVDGSVIDGLEITWGDTDHGQGPTGTAIRTGKPVVLRDIRIDSRTAPWRTTADHQGVVAGIALPLQHGPRVIGALSIYASETDAFDLGEIELLMELAGDVVAGLKALEERDSAERASQQRRSLEDQLRQAQKMEALGTLAGGVAHDFNNLLTGILGNLQLAEMDLVPGHPAAGAIDEAQKASRRARDLVARILSFSRREKNERTVVPLGPVVEEAVQLLKASLPKSIDVVSSVEPDCPPVRCCAAQIHQVVMNLATNSLHAMADSGGLLLIRVYQAEPSRRALDANPKLVPGRCVVLSVRDTGCGMEPAVMKRIFEPFFTTKEVGEGTGLGLAMVHGIVESHGGSVTVDSSPGKGTSFEIYLPAAHVAR